MTEPEFLSASDATRLLSETARSEYRLVGRLAGGETGAHELVGPNGVHVVVKWELRPSSQVLRRRAVGLTDRLREQAGWPVPRLRTVEGDGCLFVIQELMAGAPVELVTHALVDQLLELHAARLGIERASDDSRWPDVLVPTLTVGGVGYCLHEPLRQYDTRTRSLIERIEAIGRGLDPHALGGGDIVFWDLHPGNLLQIDGALAAVVDTDFVTTGDAAFDLASLALASLALPCEPGVRHRLLDLGVKTLDPTKRDAYLGHLFLRYLDWAIRKGRVDHVEFWLDCANRLFTQ